VLARQVLDHLNHAPALFALVILEIGSCFLPEQAWTMILLLYTSCHSWDDRCVSLYPALG
jgi:hypothetical protein